MTPPIDDLPAFRAAVEAWLARANARPTATVAANGDFTILPYIAEHGDPPHFEPLRFGCAGRWSAVLELEQVDEIRTGDGGVCWVRPMCVGRLEIALADQADDIVGKYDLGVTAKTGGCDQILRDVAFWLKAAAQTRRGQARQMLAAADALDPTRQPDPVAGEGDVWAEIIAGLPPGPLRDAATARRQLGIDRYGVPLQRNNGRDTVRDLLEEVLDGMAYAAAVSDADAFRALKMLAARLLDDGIAKRLPPVRPSEDKRQTGRTTRMLAEALRAAEVDGRTVYVVMGNHHECGEHKRNPKYRKLRFETLQTLHALSLHTGRLAGAHPDCVVFMDHAVMDSSFAWALAQRTRFDSPEPSGAEHPTTQDPTR